MRLPFPRRVIRYRFEPSGYHPTLAVSAVGPYESGRGRMSQHPDRTRNRDWHVWRIPDSFDRKMGRQKDNTIPWYVLKYQRRLPLFIFLSSHFSVKTEFLRSVPVPFLSAPPETLRDGARFDRSSEIPVIFKIK